MSGSLEASIMLLTGAAILLSSLRIFIQCSLLLVANILFSSSKIKFLFSSDSKANPKSSNPLFSKFSKKPNNSNVGLQ